MHIKKKTGFIHLQNSRANRKHKEDKDLWVKKYTLL